MSTLRNSSGRSDSTAAPLSTIGAVEDYQACLILKCMSLGLTPSEIEATEGLLMLAAATNDLARHAETAVPARLSVKDNSAPTGKASNAPGAHLDVKPALPSNISPAELEAFQHGWDIHNHNYETNTYVEDAWAAQYQQPDAARMGRLACCPKVRLILHGPQKGREPKLGVRPDKKPAVRTPRVRPVSKPVPKPAAKAQSKSKRASQTSRKPASKAPEASVAPLALLAELATTKGSASTVSPPLEQPSLPPVGGTLRGTRVRVPSKRKQEADESEELTKRQNGLQ
ncbi:hypothetical protein AOQ84DRAFT_369678 [Glonium stellatum]|uniref:Uncharacterized protein n=1 Tax=Glonium stellatum TaxID=574774 RepID=A0A8E2JLT7_9PEZI|nr:hypothetical protein AOQ84DRAFT_369678 [Glonium stellatum]